MEELRQSPRILQIKRFNLLQIEIFRIFLRAVHNTQLPGQDENGES